MIFYFTGTGNSLYVAKKIGGRLIPIAQAVKLPRQIYRDEVIGFVFPTYAVGIPRIVEAFVKNNMFQANYSFAIMTCGGTLGSSLARFAELLVPQGLKLDYTNKVIMIDNYGTKSMDKQLKRYSPQKEAAVIDKIAADIHGRVYAPKRSNLLIQAYTGLMNLCSGLCYDDADKHYTLQSDKCTKCGLCQRICPAGNIELTPFPTFLHKCEGCYACIHACPQKALSPNRRPVEVQYRHPQIQLSELLTSGARSGLDFSQASMIK